ncbi:MAG: hypothetical protein J0665_04020 [Deltaproteobacteria bacterium]|jgi:hypothetical protein|nr:hypothetical protein [Deltaproteobacteria bacterium]
MHNSEQKPDILPQRLCSEIQLFDLCDLDSCSNRSGRYCTDSILLGRFERIAENELRLPDRYTAEDIDDAEAYDGDLIDEDEDSIDDLDGGEDDFREE